jgi:hypothetical protein
MAMWAEVSPDGRWVWASSGTDLLAYDASQVSAANAGPAGAPLAASKRVRASCGRRASRVRRSGAIASISPTTAAPMSRCCPTPSMR